jgi:hypothetical protein
VGTSVAVRVGVGVPNRMTALTRLQSARIARIQDHRSPSIALTFDLWNKAD